MIHCLLLESTADTLEKSTLNDDDQDTLEKSTLNDDDQGKEIELSLSYTNEGDRIISSFTTIIPKFIEY